MLCGGGRFCCGSRLCSGCLCSCCSSLYRLFLFHSGFNRLDSLFCCGRRSLRCSGFLGFCLCRFYLLCSCCGSLRSLSLFRCSLGSGLLCRSLCLRCSSLFRCRQGCQNFTEYSHLVPVALHGQNVCLCAAQCVQQLCGVSGYQYIVTLIVIRFNGQLVAVCGNYGIKCAAALTGNVELYCNSSVRILGAGVSSIVFACANISSKVIFCHSFRSIRQKYAGISYAFPLYYRRKSGKCQGECR